MQGVKKAGGGTFALLVVIASLAGCGGSSKTMSASAYEAKGNLICVKALGELHALHAPTSVDQLPLYLKTALTIGSSEINQLASLDPPSAYKQALDTALSGSRQEASTLSAFQTKLAKKQVTAAAFTGVSKQLGTTSAQVNAQFRKAGLPECSK
jgi:hypothetical protein